MSLNPLPLFRISTAHGGFTVMSSLWTGTIPGLAEHAGSGSRVQLLENSMPPFINISRLSPNTMIIVSHEGHFGHVLEVCVSHGKKSLFSTSVKNIYMFSGRRTAEGGGPALLPIRIRILLQASAHIAVSHLLCEYFIKDSLLLRSEVVDPITHHS